MGFLELLNLAISVASLGAVIGVMSLRRNWTGSMASTRSSLIFFLASLTFLSIIHAVNNLLTNSNLVDSPLAGPYMLGSFVASISLVNALYLALGPIGPTTYSEFLAYTWRERHPYVLLLLYTVVMAVDSLLSYFPWIATIRSASFALATLLYLGVLLAFLAHPIQRLLVRTSQKLSSCLFVIITILTLTLILGGIYFQLALPTTLQLLWDWGILALSFAFSVIFLRTPFTYNKTLRELHADEKSGLTTNTDRVPRSMSLFSHSIGLSHHQLAGGWFILNIQPSSQFEESVKGFVEETRYYGDRVIIMTHSGSPVQEILQSRRDIVRVLLSPDSTSIKLGSQNEVVLPIHNVMQISAFLATILSLDQQQRFSILLDSISYVSSTLGFSKAHRTLNRLIDVTTTPRVTVLALVDPQQIKPAELAAIRELLERGSGGSMHT